MAERILAKRCAIYVRKSSEEGLDMSYNSLAAQSDACAAYIASQKHEGWMQLPTIYEDGGYSGGNMDRPGVQQLLGDVATGKIDIIVVYKIDRLTRSLTDFAKLNEILDNNSVSFVAVTQQFNTSTSMGRLTLNVLLSFAQFEREVAGERIRDKVAASKKKGIWMGGPVPLGYAVKDRKLDIVPEEAIIVRNMFTRYLDLRSVHLLQRELQQEGVRSRRRLLQDGRNLGGVVLGRGAISHMLKNPLYLGQIRHAGALHQGQHEAIVDKDLFAAVQLALAQSGPGDGARAKRASPALLKGLVFDTQGHRLQPTHAVKNGIRYHYYTSARRLRDAKDDPSGIRVPAGDLDRIVVKAIADRLMDRSGMQPWLAQYVPFSDLPHYMEAAASLPATIASNNQTAHSVIRSIIGRITLSRTGVRVALSDDGLRISLVINSTGVDHEESAPPKSQSKKHAVQINQPEVVIQGSSAAVMPDIMITSHLLRCGKQVKLVLGPDNGKQPEPDPKLVDMVLQARRWFEDLSSNSSSSLTEIGMAAGVDRTYISRLITLAFLAPDIVDRIVTGDHAATLTPERLRKACPLPPRWEEQRAVLLT